ncbi:MAG: EamA family transporter [Rhizobiales bacterium]|nr:EamA family transporter [Hyphomicrobiales bacterium]
MSEISPFERRAPQPPARRDRIPLGIVLMIASTLLFTVMSAISTWLTETYPIGEVLFTRAAIALAACALIVLPRRGRAVFRTQRVSHHGMRSISQAFSQSFILIAFSMMPFAGVVAISFTAPLFATLLAALLLHERVGPTRWTALLVGFVGVLIMTTPDADMFQVGALFALGNAVLYASVTVAVRGMTATESTETLIMYQVTFLTLLFAPLLLLGFVMPTWIAAGAMVASGLLNVLAQYFWTRSLHLAPASAVTPFYYVSLIWAMIAGFLVWSDVPTLALLAGSAIVTGSGLFLLWRESGRI